MAQVSGVAVAAVGAGLVFLWSGLKGASILTTIQDMIQGKKPSGTPVNQIGVPTGSGASALGSAASAAAAAAGVGGQTVCASMYGGASDPSSGVHGYKGDTLTGRMAFAELNMGTALGNLPYKQKVRVTYKGKSVVAEKLDIGAGGAGCGGHSRAIDLWWETARAIGFNGLDVVTVEVI